MMKSVSKVAGATAAVLMVSSVTASAALLDFTDAGAYEDRDASEATGTLDGVGWRVTGTPGDSLTYTPFDGLQSDIGPLEGDLDGIGVDDDEITYDSEAGLSEYVTVTFDRAVRATGFYFLDLFTAQDGASNEIAEVFMGSDTSGMLIAAFDASDAAVVGNDSGFRFGTLGEAVSSSAFTFAAFTENDGVGFADFALAGIEAEPTVAPIPLPAGALLLGSGLLAFGGAAARRRKA